MPNPTTTNREGDPLANLSAIRDRVDALSRTLSNSVNSNTPLSRPASDTITEELTTAIHHIIINGAALLSASHVSPPKSNSEDDDLEIVELDVMELITSDNSHICEICGKGFKRDANLRMHMRAHGDKYKAVKCLSKPDNVKTSDEFCRKTTRFSCPYVGCSKNRKHKDFKPLKSVVCVKNHFKRSHCPKKFRCNRCNTKCFSLMSDLKSHMKHCVVEVEEDDGEKLKCCCGMMFGKKEELFEHMSLFEGHMPFSGNKSDVVMEERDDDEWLKDMGVWSSIEDLINF